MPQHSTRLPSRKWFATQITAAAALLTAYITAGGWNDTLAIALVGLLSQAAVGYLVPNADPAQGSTVAAPTRSTSPISSGSPVSG